MALRNTGIALACCIGMFAGAALAQGGGGGGGSGGSAGASAGAGSSGAGSSGAGMGTNASSAASGPSAAPGMGTQDTTTGVNRTTNNQLNSPNVQPPTANKSPAAAQAERNAGVGHAANGQPIGTPGTGTSQEDQMRR